MKNQKLTPAALGEKQFDMGHADMNLNLLQQISYYTNNIQIMFLFTKIYIN